MNYRKKPIVIRAIQFTIKNQFEICDFFNGEPFEFVTFKGEIIQMTITTLEGTMTASIGDWIIKGVKGEFYPCKNDIFEATYEEVL